jgi:hypothetical protein
MSLPYRKHSEIILIFHPSTFSSFTSLCNTTQIKFIFKALVLSGCTLQKKSMILNFKVEFFSGFVGNLPQWLNSKLLSGESLKFENALEIILSVKSKTRVI